MQKVFRVKSGSSKYPPLRIAGFVVKPTLTLLSDMGVGACIISRRLIQYRLQNTESVSRCSGE